MYRHRRDARSVHERRAPRLLRAWHSAGSRGASSPGRVAKRIGWPRTSPYRPCSTGRTGPRRVRELAGPGRSVDICRFTLGKDWPDDSEATPPELILAPGAAGTFDDSGAMASCLPGRVTTPALLRRLEPGDTGAISQRRRPRRVARRRRDVRAARGPYPRPQRPRPVLRRELLCPGGGQRLTHVVRLGAPLGDRQDPAGARRTTSSTRLLRRGSSGSATARSRSTWPRTSRRSRAHGCSGTRRVSHVVLAPR